MAAPADASQESDPQRPVHFTWADAWVLAAVSIGGGMKGAGLKEIIAAGDLINRAILTGPMLRTGLAKLMHKGYVVDEGGSFTVAGGARAAITKTLLRPSATFSVMEFFEDFLEATPYSLIEDEAVEWSYAPVSDERVDKAAEDYLREIAPPRGGL
jgi:hypothetical protein